MTRFLFRFKLDINIVINLSKFFDIYFGIHSDTIQQRKLNKRGGFKK